MQQKQGLTACLEAGELQRLMPIMSYKLSTF